MSREIYLTEKDIERFWSKVDIRGEDECWEWKAYRMPTGYGQMRIGGRNGSSFLSNRISLTIKLNRQILPDLWSCHTCDNPPCCNPKHLWEGTVKEDMEDMARKGRAFATAHPERVARGERHGSRTHPELVARGDKNGRRLHPELYPSGDEHWARKYPEKVKKGESHYNAKTTPEQILEIKRLYATDEYSQRDLAKMYNLTQAQICNIVNEKQWRVLLVP